MAVVNGVDFLFFYCVKLFVTSPSVILVLIYVCDYHWVYSCSSMSTRVGFFLHASVKYQNCASWTFDYRTLFLPSGHTFYLYKYRYCANYTFVSSKQKVNTLHFHTKLPPGMLLVKAKLI